MKKYLKYLIIPAVLLIAWQLYKTGKKVNPNPDKEIGQVVDSFNGVYVYFNGGVGNTSGRNLSEDGYNIGIKYQCVEFVKRYYYQFYHHKMPDSYGNAKDFFDNSLPDSTYNSKRDLVQYTNGSKVKPMTGDLVIFGPTTWNQYGHVAIITEVTDDEVFIIQQNPGPFADSRISIPLIFEHNTWSIGAGDHTLGWLRKQ